MDNKNSFLLYNDYFEYINELTIPERGELLTAIFEQRLNGETNTDLSDKTKIVFMFINNQIERANAEYSKKIEQLSINGRKGGRGCRH